MAQTQTSNNDTALEHCKRYYSSLWVLYYHNIIIIHCYNFIHIPTHTDTPPHNTTTPPHDSPIYQSTHAATHLPHTHTLTHTYKHTRTRAYAPAHTNTHTHIYIPTPWAETWSGSASSRIQFVSPQVSARTNSRHRLPPWRFVPAVRKGRKCSSSSTASWRIAL